MVTMMEKIEMHRVNRIKEKTTPVQLLGLVKGSLFSVKCEQNQLQRKRNLFL